MLSCILTAVPISKNKKAAVLPYVSSNNRKVQRPYSSASLKMLILICGPISKTFYGKMLKCFHYLLSNLHKISCSTLKSRGFARCASIPESSAS